MHARRPPGAPGVGASMSLFLGLLAAAAALNVLFRTATRGPAVSADGVAMWSAALNVLAGHGLVDFAGRPLTIWAPAPALLMAAGGRAGLDPLDAMRWINAAALAATVGVFGHWLAIRTRRRAVALAGAAIAAVSYPLGYYAGYVLGEPLALLFVFAALAQLDAFLRGRGGPGALALAGGFAGLAVTARYPAAVLIPVGSAALLLDRRAPASGRLKRALAFGGIATAPLAVIVCRNWMATGTLVGRPLGDRSLYIARDNMDLLLHAGKALGISLLPGAGPEWLAHLPWLVAGALCALSVCLMVACPRAFPLRHAKAPRADPSVGLFFGFAAAYLASLYPLVRAGSGQFIDSRLLLPAFLPALAAGALLADRFLRIEARGREAPAKRLLAAALAAGCVVHATLAIRQNAVVTAEWRARGDAEWGAYNSAYRDGSATLRNVVPAPPDAVVYSNEAPLLWYHDRTAPPGRYRELPRRAEGLGAVVAPGSAIVWFDKRLFDGMGYGVSDLLADPGVRLAGEWEDGKLLRVAGPGAVP